MPDLKLTPVTMTPAPLERYACSDLTCGMECAPHELVWGNEGWYCYECAAHKLGVRRDDGRLFTYEEWRAK